MNSQMLRVVTEADEAAAAAAAAAALIAPAPLPLAPEVPAVVITNEVEALADPDPARSWAGRAFALSLLVATVAGVGWLGVQVYYVITDSWIAPLHLSPDNDSVAALRMQHQRHRAELARLDAEVTRLDGELVAIDAAVARLTDLRGSAQATLRWQAESSQREVAGLDAATALIDRQRGLLVQLGQRQAALVERARTDLAAGMIDRTALDREEQVRDQLALELTELDRQRAEAKVRRATSHSSLQALRGGGRGDRASRMPEVAAGEEHAIRIELEIERLRAEAIGQRALRAVAADSVATQRELLTELEARPLYRAMTHATDIAFVPYDQLRGVEPGARIMDCTWGVFRCRQVGAIAELVPGEVVTQDPWGKLARGQYAVIHLDDADAIRERVLRVRR